MKDDLSEQGGEVRDKVENTFMAAFRKAMQTSATGGASDDVNIRIAEQQNNLGVGGSTDKHVIDDVILQQEDFNGSFRCVTSWFYLYIHNCDKHEEPALLLNR